MTTILYLIRHGLTKGGRERRYKRSIDVPISEEGLRQIAKASDFINAHLDGAHLAAVYSSPLSRALESARVIAMPHGLTPIVDYNLRERHFGIWEGLTFDEISRKYPLEFQRWAENPLEHSPIGGESSREVRDRIMPAVETIVSSHAGERVAIVGHGGVNRIILCELLGMPLEHMFRIEQDNAAVNIVEFHEKYPSIRLVNYAYR
jgi:alpha-ribazole phosphatase